MKKPLIRYNLSSETKISDLLGRYVGELDSWAGIVVKPGPFLQAFSEGYCLLLDEINLASPSVLQCIEESLDSGIISVEIPGMQLKEIKMHPEFRLIATQNPNKGLFANKRQDLGLKFLSRFQIINFPQFNKEELLKIGKGLVNSFKYNDENDIITKLVDFHMEWSEKPEVAEDVYCFTIREIAATVRAISNGANINETIMTIYGARYQKQLRKELENTLQKYPSLSQNKNNDFQYPDDFPECFHNESLTIALKSILFSFSNNRHVILTGAKGCGKTQLARWVSEWYDGKNKNENEKTKEFFCICTEKINCSDLIGKQKPIENNKAGHELIQWKPGFLTQAIQNGKCAVLDSIDEAPSTVTERLNSLFDQTYDGEQKMFDIPENPQKSQIPIHKNFRLLCTCDIEKIHFISPAFLNRFDVIVLEDQLNEINELETKELISILLNRYKKFEQPYNNIHIQNDDDILITYNEINFESNESSYDDLVETFDDDDEVEEEEENEIFEENSDPDLRTFNQNNHNSLEFTPEIIDFIYDSFIKSKMTIYWLAFLCKAVVIYSKLLINNVDQKDIVEFAINMLKKNEDFQPNPKIHSNLQLLLDKTNKLNDDNQFFFENSSILCEFITKIFAASLIGLPVCISGPTGAGKTSAARAFATIRPIISIYHNRFQMYSFHSGTKSNQFYGTTTIKDGKVYFYNGTLTISMKEGLTFIADEMNLSTTGCMKTLAPALEPSLGRNIFIPGLGESIIVNNNFFFIACQNELGTIGRNAIPESISSRFRYFTYPEQTENDISNICLDIAKSCYKNGEQIKIINNTNIKQIGKYMLELNKLKQRIIPPWSLRDITKLFIRIHHQDLNDDNYTNLTFYHHILFYTLASVNENDIHYILDDILNLIVKVFSLRDDTKNELKECYLSIPEIKKINNLTFLMKGNTGIAITIFPLHKELKNLIKLSSFLNCAFQLLLSDPSESILLIGNSGFKTFLAQQFLCDAKVITLNQESTVSQLLGSSGFFTNKEAKLFYLEYICKMCYLNNEYLGLQKKLLNKTLTKEEIIELTNNRIKILPNSFHYAIQHLTEKLFENDKQNNCVISNIILEFRPGLFLSAILERKSLILKNLSNLPTIVLERFNELFSGKHSLTLNEDIHNTFTPENNKELIKFNHSYRIIATSNSPYKLSEAVLSRFTVIAVPEYKEEERKTVLESYIRINQLKCKEPEIDLLQNFSKVFYDQFKQQIKFPQMLKSFEMLSKLKHEFNTQNSEDQTKLILSIIIYRLCSGLLERQKQREILLKLFKNINIDLPSTLQNFNECPFVKLEENPQCYKSKITGLSLKTTNESIRNQKIAFTGKFTEMIDVLHLGLITNTPVIFEGKPGQGKQTAINYIANFLGYEVVNIIISQSTKVDDLLGKITIDKDNNNNIRVGIIETKLVKAMKSNQSNSIIVFHNINNASPAVLEVMVSIFDNNHQNILLSNGLILKKGKMNLVAIFNPQNGFSNRERLPTSLIYSSLYHIVYDPNNDDISKIVLKQFEDLPYFDEATLFFEQYLKTNNICNESLITHNLTLNDITKYIIFRNATYGHFDKIIISQMLFAYRFTQEEFIRKVLYALQMNEMKFNPVFIYNLPAKQLNIYINQDNENGIILPIITEKINKEEIQSIIECLTLPEKHCLLFLACSYLANRACVIQGNTASGKSHTIRLFAKMLGKKLYIYQMNADTGISILTGQSILDNSISIKEINLLRDAFSKLNKFNKLKNYIKNNINENPNAWKPNNFKDLILEIEKFETNSRNLQKDQKELLDEAKQIIKDAIQPANRFNHIDSIIIKAIKNGEIVLIDGIESAPPEITEKISSLCGDEPELNLYECGKGYYFSKKNGTIHKDFRLIMTYNPTAINENKTIDQSFLNKCVSFTLPPIDSNIEYSAQILFGSLIKNSFPNKLSIQIGARMALMHAFSKSKSESEHDLFASDIEFTGRTLKFIILNFIHYQKIEENKNDLSENIYVPICKSLRLYWNSFVNQGKKQQFLQQMINHFTKEPSQNLLSKINTSNIKSRNEAILRHLLQIQSIDKKSFTNFSFSFYSFVNKCKNIQIGDIQYIKKCFDETLDIINIHKYKKDKNKLIYGKLYTIIIVSNIFKEIINGLEGLDISTISNLQLKDKDLLSFESIMQPISKFQLLIRFAKENSQCFTQYIPYELAKQDLFNIIKIINKMLKNQNLQEFNIFISNLKKNQNLIPLIDKIFPYDKFISTSFEYICYWLPLFKDLYQAKIRFTIEVKNNSYDFKFNKEKNIIYLRFVFNQEDSLLLSKETKIIIKGKCVLPFEQGNTNSSYDYNKRNAAVYQFCKEQLLCANKQILDDDYISKAINKYTESGVENPRNNHIRQLSSLFSYEKSNLIGNIWTLIYSFSKDEISELKQFLHPLELEMLQSISLIFDKIEKYKNLDIIMNFSKALINFEKPNSILWRIKSNTYKIDQQMNINSAENEIHKIDQEIIGCSKSHDPPPISMNKQF